MLKLIRRYIHKAIVWYLKRCGGEFHHGTYGEHGKYIKLFTDKEFSDHQRELIKYHRLTIERVNNKQ